MKTSDLETVEQYLDDLPPEQRAAIEDMRELILENLPEGYVECMNWGMISYEVPLERFAETYNGKPLAYLMLAAQKRHNSLYMMGVYADEEKETQLRQAYEDAGLRVDMGKSCVRFKDLSDLPTGTIAELIAGTSVEEMIAIHDRVHAK